MLGVTQFSVINWERGRFQPCRAPTLCRIIQFLGYDPLPTGDGIPERLRQKRREMGWGQQELADHLGVDRCTVTAWEAGGTIMVKAHRTLLAEFLGLAEHRVTAKMGLHWRRNDRRISY
jgi:DNA-binding XRE family transcriptional regulator